MKHILKSLLILPFLHLTCSAENEKPNIIFLFADDMAYETVRSSGRLDIDTPNLDRIAENGTSFSNAYNMGAWGGAVCVASRSMIISGKSVWDAQKTDLKGIVESKSSWPLLMKEAGYDTYMTGKWHIPSRAQDHFDKTVNIRAGMPKAVGEGYNRPQSPEHYEAGWKPWDKEQGGFWEGGKHWSEVTADDSITFIEEAKDKDAPFFMYLAFNAPHDPRQAPKEYIDQYPLDRIKMPVNFQPDHPHKVAMFGGTMRDEKLMPYPRTEYAVKVNRQEYFAIISHMDAQIGRILDALEASGKADNTYIFFTADHGLACGHHGLSGKQNMYEHSMTVPFLVSGPTVKKGERVSAPIYLQDVTATTLELAGATVPSTFYYKSLAPLLQGDGKAPWHSIYGAYMNSQRMVRHADWKLIQLPEIQHYELYNLKDDPYETTDLAGDPSHEKKLNEMKTLLERKQKRHNDPLLAGKPKDTPVAKTPALKKADLPTQPAQDPIVLPKKETPEGAPNIVFLLCDDLGYGDVQILNPEKGKILTPHLDELARSGMIFTDAHSGSAVCTPTRYGLLTGRYSWRTSLQSAVVQGFSPNLIAPETPSIGAYLQSYGYHTSLFGKWHLNFLYQDPDTGENLDSKLKRQPAPVGSKIPDGPLTRGFDRFHGIHHAGSMKGIIEGDTVIKHEDEVNFLPRLTRESIAYLKERAKTPDQPFFLYLPYGSPHTPIVPSPEWKGKSGINLYADFVMENDHSVGEIMKTLEELGMRENTLVIFSADNGCSKAANFTQLEAAGHYASAHLRGSKADAWDGGHRVPFLASWPARITPGTTNNSTICLTDFYETVVDILDGETPPNACQDSVSFLPAFKNEEIKSTRKGIIHHSISGHFSYRLGDWKLILAKGSGGWTEPKENDLKGKDVPPAQLYNLAEDIAEQNNLYESHPEEVEKLLTQLKEDIYRGRSTEGPDSPNDVPDDKIKLWKSGQ